MVKNSKSKSKSKSKSSKKMSKSNLNIIKSPLIEGLDNIEQEKTLNNANHIKISSILSNIIIMAIFLGIIVLIINVTALMWINKLDTMNCVCSESYMRTYIKYFLYFNIVIISIDILLNIYIYFNNISILEFDNNFLYKIYKAIRGIFFIFSLINVVIVIIFINKLKEINCECSEDIRREIYWVYNIVQACYISIVLLFAIIALITVLANRRQ
jgi:hypothetical protein